MPNSGKEILEDIDATIEQLIANATAMKRAFVSDVLLHEIEALQKTQESLLARLMHRHTLLQEKKKKITPTKLQTKLLQKKMIDYDKAHIRMMAEARKQLAIKNRKKPLKMSKRAKRSL